MTEYLVISNLTTTSKKTAPYREAHLNYLSKLKNAGKLLMAGRFTDGTGGLYILVENSYAAAEQLAKADPYHIKGLRRFSIISWDRKL